MGLIVRSKIKELVGEFNVGSDVADVLEERAVEMLKTAVDRAKANGRRTVLGRDV